MINSFRPATEISCWTEISAETSAPSLQTAGPYPKCRSCSSNPHVEGSGCVHELPAVRWFSNRTASGLIIGWCLGARSREAWESIGPRRSGDTDWSPWWSVWVWVAPSMCVTTNHDSTWWFLQIGEPPCHSILTILSNKPTILEFPILRNTHRVCG